MSLKQQKIGERKHYKTTQAEIRNKIEIERTLLSEPKKLEKVLITVNNIKKYLAKNPKKPVYLAEISQVADLQNFLFVEKPSIQTIAQVFHDFGGIIFLDEDLCPIDGTQLKVLEIEEIVKVPAKHEEKEINLKKLQKEIDKILHKSKTGNKSVHEAKCEFAQELLQIFSKPNLTK